jgi:hypothetical protein
MLITPDGGGTCTIDDASTNSDNLSVAHSRGRESDASASLTGASLDVDGRGPAFPAVSTGSTAQSFCCLSGDVPQRANRRSVPLGAPCLDAVLPRCRTSPVRAPHRLWRATRPRSSHALPSFCSADAANCPTAREPQIRSDLLRARWRASCRPTTERERTWAACGVPTTDASTPLRAVRGAVVVLAW